jgi:hypothetical protein
MSRFDVFSRFTNAGTLPNSTLDLVDRMLDSEIEWRESVATVGNAYQSWCAAADRDRRLSFACYVAALDQEEAAAQALASSTLQLAFAVT